MRESWRKLRENRGLEGAEDPSKYDLSHRYGPDVALADTQEHPIPGFRDTKKAEPEPQKTEGAKKTDKSKIEKIAYRTGVLLGKLKDGGRGAIEDFLSRKKEIASIRERIQSATREMEEYGRTPSASKEEIARRFEKLKGLYGELALIEGGDAPERIGWEKIPGHVKEGSDELSAVQEIWAKKEEIEKQIYSSDWQPEEPELEETLERYKQWVEMQITWSRLRKIPEIETGLKNLKEFLYDALGEEIPEEDLQSAKPSVQLNEMGEKETPEIKSPHHPSKWPGTTAPTKKEKGPGLFRQIKDAIDLGIKKMSLEELEVHLTILESFARAPQLINSEDDENEKLLERLEEKTERTKAEIKKKKEAAERTPSPTQRIQDLLEQMKGKTKPEKKEILKKIIKIAETRLGEIQKLLAE